MTRSDQDLSKPIRPVAQEAQQCAKEGLQKDFISTLAKTLDAANRFIIKQLENAGLVGLVPSHGDILNYLFDHDDVCMCELAAACKRDPSTVTTLVKKLAALGYVGTKKNSDDKRVTDIFLTEKGRSLKSTFDKISRELERVQMHDIGMRELTNTSETLRRIYSNFEEELKN